MSNTGREKLEKDFRSAAAYSYEATMGEYSFGSIERARRELEEARAALEAAGAVVDNNHNITWPTVFYGVLDSATSNGSLRALGMSASFLTEDKRQAVETRDALNEAYKPEYQTFVVVRLTVEED